MGKEVVPSARLRAPEGIAQLLRDLIHDRTGIFFEDARLEFLIDKLEPAARERGFSSFLQYYYALKDNKHDEWNRAWEVLSVQETYFFREMCQINALVEILVPEWFRKSSLPFRVWSAACATGEEPYTIAMAMVEAGFGAHPIEITATDASVAALQKARLAVFRENSFRACPQNFREKYFQRVPGGWKLSDDIKHRVAFTRANLFERGEVAPMARVQAIFCRNVFIYFSRHAIRQTVAMMAARMPPGGYLFVGASESLMKLTTDFELKEIGDALVYVRL
jgi:chemotaxis protein methyltransferase CheR